MRTSSNRMPYLAPQSETVSLRVEGRFMVDSLTGSSSFSATFGFGNETSVDETGGELQ